ncbi:TetR/AcrR family transcriptional regulator [Antrihabitans sp. YC2-6]|uniref:TetR/AcrR family transcriptional regulator n=1 Tax=Antrihabitans sp. YC2-6 TaxID=2799498 RepID=UPI0018F64DD2|nr:TetR family transcriptional regulator [Antrihabitans sp. YC2-6]MBJ8343315.1 TetR family transcriptional regulator [Antrihabitans sp. YC2-6]
MAIDRETATAEPPRRTRPRDRKVTILAAASRLFAASGYHGTSMADIASAVGISSTALYRHFANKQELLGRALMDGLDTTLTRLDDARGEPDLPILPALIELALDNRDLTRLWQREVRSLSDTDRRAVLHRIARVHASIMTAVLQARPDLAEPERALLAWAALSVAVSPSNHHVELPRAAFVDQLLTMTTHVLETTVAPAEFTAPVQQISPETDRVLERGFRTEQLIVVAARLFNERGYAAVSMEDIGSAAGIAGPSVYHHFAGKSELLTAIVERAEQWISLYTAQALSSGSSPTHALDLLLRSYIRMAVEQPDLFGAAMTEVVHIPGEQGAHLRKASREGVSKWARLMQNAEPDLTVDAARVRIQALTTVVADLIRHERIRRRSDALDVLVAVCSSVMRPTAELVDSPSGSSE